MSKKNCRWFAWSADGVHACFAERDFVFFDSFFFGRELVGGRKPVIFHFELCLLTLSPCLIIELSWMCSWHMNKRPDMTWAHDGPDRPERTEKLVTWMYNIEEVTHTASKSLIRGPLDL